MVCSQGCHLRRSSKGASKMLRSGHIHCSVPVDQARPAGGRYTKWNAKQTEYEQERKVRCLRAAVGYYYRPHNKGKPLA